MLDPWYYYFQQPGMLEGLRLHYLPVYGDRLFQQKESIIFVGANDGMLHAFKTGILTTSGMNPTNHQVETFTKIPTRIWARNCGRSYPQNSLPYLRCLRVPPASSCHLYYNDLSPYVTTMVSNGVTKTVLIGGMRLGGGTVQASSAANYCFNSSGVSNGATCESKTFCQSPYNSSCCPHIPQNIPADTCSGASTISTGLIASSNPAICTSSPCTVSCSNSTTCYSSSPLHRALLILRYSDITRPPEPQTILGIQPARFWVTPIQDRRLFAIGTPPL